MNAELCAYVSVAAALVSLICVFLMIGLQRPVSNARSGQILNAQAHLGFAHKAVSGIAIVAIPRIQRRRLLVAEAFWAKVRRACITAGRMLLAVHKSVFQLHPLVLSGAVSKIEGLFLFALKRGHLLHQQRILLDQVQHGQPGTNQHFGKRPGVLRIRCQRLANKVARIFQRGHQGSSFQNTCHREPPYGRPVAGRDAMADGIQFLPPGVSWGAAPRDGVGLRPTRDDILAGIGIAIFAFVCCLIATAGQP